jgi:hypothetical protein
MKISKIAAAAPVPKNAYIIERTRMGYALRQTFGQHVVREQFFATHAEAARAGRELSEQGQPGFDRTAA